MKIVEMGIDKLVPYENNAKLHSEAQIEHISESIKQFGFKQPIVVDENNVIIIGHGRYFAAQRLGLDKVPVKIEKGLSPDKVDALRLADNKTNESEWDYFLRAAEIDEITEIDMSDFGFELADDEAPEQKLNDGGEISLGSFDDEKFKYECPNCKFKFNKGDK